VRDWITRHRRVLVALVIFACLVGGFLLAAGLLTYRTYQHVRGPLHSAQATLSALAHNPNSLDSAVGRAQDEVQLEAALAGIDAAQAQIDGSTGLKLLGVVPGLHAQRVGLVQLVSDLRTTTESADELLRSVDLLAAQSHGTSVSLPDLTSLGAVLGAAHARLVADDRPTSGLWGPIGNDRLKFDREDRRAASLLHQGQVLTNYALPFLGADGPRTYLVVGENNAEMRDEGDTLSYSLLTTSGGVIGETTGGTLDTHELSSPAPGITIPAGTQAVFGRLFPTETWQSTNATADFSFSGHDMQSMFAASVGTHVDGVIGIDVVALQGLLALTGPVVVPGIPEPVTAANAAFVLLDQLYTDLAPNSSQGPRREELSAVTSAAVHQLQAGQVDLVALARVLSTEIGERHLQLWDENPRYEADLRTVGASGDVDTDVPSRTFHVAVENATATKLDIFIGVSISDTVYLTSNGSAEVDTAVTLTNRAPAGQPPSYQLGPDGINSHVAGEYVGRVLLWGPRGSEQSGSVAESGLRLNEEDLDLLPGHSATAQFETTIHHAVQHGQLRMVFVPQPRLYPETLSVHIASGLVPRSRATVHATIAKTTTLTWKISGNGG
jgi:hypothetical protein